MDSAFSFIAEAKTIPYDQGCKKGYNVIPKRIQTKIDKGQSLSANEKLVVNGLRDAESDSQLEVEKRIPWLFEFDEEYELDSDDDDNDDEEDLEGDDDDREQDKVAVKKAKGKEKKEKDAPKKKKRKKDKGKESMDFDDDDDVSEKIDKKKIKRKRLSDEKSQSSKKKKQKSSRKLDEEIMDEVAQEDAFFQEDAPSEDDKGDDDFSVEGESDSDEEDELYEEKPKTSKTSKAAKSSGKKEKEVKAKKTKPSKEKQVKKEKKIDKMQEEQNKFEDCEEVFVPLMSKLNKDDLDLDKAGKLLKKILQEVDILTPSFIKEYQIGLLIRDVRNRYKEVEKLNLLCKNITSKMKTLYKEKIQSVPEGFTPKLNKKPIKLKVCDSFYLNVVMDE